MAGITVFLFGIFIYGFALISSTDSLQCTGITDKTDLGKHKEVEEVDFQEPLEVTAIFKGIIDGSNIEHQMFYQTTKNPALVNISNYTDLFYVKLIYLGPKEKDTEWQYELKLVHNPPTKEMYSSLVDKGGGATIKVEVGDKTNPKSCQAFIFTQEPKRDPRRDTDNNKDETNTTNSWIVGPVVFVALLILATATGFFVYKRCGNGKCKEFAMISSSDTQATVVGHQAHHTQEVIRV